MGDWFDTIAVYTIALHLTGSSRSVALIMVARFLPSVVMGPLSGVVADRFSRRINHDHCRPSARHGGSGFPAGAPARIRCGWFTF